MTFHKTTRNNTNLTAKPTLTIDSDWSAALYWDDEESPCSFLIESLDERFELVLYVTDKEKLKCIIDQFLGDLQELYIETE